jgi:hypothetical protein
MAGAVGEAGEMDGRLRLSITMTGLAPGEAVSLRAAGVYIVEWVCGSLPEPCGPIGCGPSFDGETEGTTKAAAQAVAASDGTAAARIELAAVPPAESCPTDSSSPLMAKRYRWEKVSIADPVHGLLLTPDPVERGFIY